MFVHGLSLGLTAAWGGGTTFILGALKSGL